MTAAHKFTFLLLFMVGLHMSLYAQDETAKIKNMTRGADVIVSGKVKEKKSNWNAAKTRIYTMTTVEVDEYLKGNQSRKSVEVLTLGGEVGDVGEVYTHMPSFDDDEEVVLFLKKSEKSQSYSVMNGEEGKIKIHRKSKSDENISGEDTHLRELKSKIKSYLKEE